MPHLILYDNTKISVAKIRGNGKRVRTKEFEELQSHYLFEDKFERPAKGNDKGDVEGVVGYSHRHFMVSLRVADTFYTLNAKLLDGCIKRQRATLRGQTETIAECMRSDTAALMVLPIPAHDACHKVSTRV